MSGIGGTSDNTGQGDADNVIRFPRDWFGSKEDLIPFGSAADRLEAEAAAAQRDQAYGLTADDFWGEGAQALHQPVGVPPHEVSSRPPVDQSRERNAPVAAQEISTPPGRTVKLRPALGPRSLPSGFVRVIAAVSVLGAVAALTLFTLVTGGPVHSKTTAAKPAAAQLAVTKLPRNPAKLPTTWRAPAVNGAQALSGRQIAAAEQLLAERIPSARGVRIRPSTKHRQGDVSSQPVRADDSSNATGDNDTAATSKVGGSEKTVGDRVSGPSKSAAAASDISASSGKVAGPGGLGGVVGPSCDPICSATRSSSEGK